MELVSIGRLLEFIPRVRQLFPVILTTKYTILSIPFCIPLLKHYFQLQALVSPTGIYKQTDSYDWGEHACINGYSMMMSREFIDFAKICTKLATGWQVSQWIMLQNIKEWESINNNTCESHHCKKKYHKISDLLERKNVTCMWHLLMFNEIENESHQDSPSMANKKTPVAFKGIFQSKIFNPNIFLQLRMRVWQRIV